MLNVKRLVLKLTLAISFMLASQTTLGDNAEWDGRYNSFFNFKMSSKSVCPKKLPIEIEIEINEGIVSGFIFNNGGGNGHSFCKLYHNGSISGKVKSNGDLDLKVKQKDSHSRKYSSHRIKGNIEGRLRLNSISPKYHPSHAFEFTRIVDKSSDIKIQEVVLKNPQESKSLTSSELETINNHSNLEDNNEFLQDQVQSLEISSINKSVVDSNYELSKIKSVDEAQVYLNELQATINMYITINNVIAEKKNEKSDEEKYKEAINKEIKRLTKQKDELQEILSNRFSTPIWPKNSNLNVSAFRSAETFPKIPFYIPGTNEIGQTLIIPRITDEGYLQYQFDFLDPTSEYDNVRERISFNHQDIDSLIFGLGKIDEWTEVAQQNKVNRRISKTAICIPNDKCDNKKLGISSTEVVFQIYEDGSTSGRIQRNKGLFSSGYNLSVESTVLLSAYLTYMRDVGFQEFQTGSMSDKQIENLFQ